MAYIGKTPTIGNFQKCDAITVVNGQASYTMQVGGTNVSPESENHMLVSLNGILQSPTDSFTVSGSTITFASNLQTGDVIDFIMLLGNVLDLGVPSDNTVSTAKLVDGSVTSAKLASGTGGKVLQVIQTYKTDVFSTTSESLVDITGMSATITPSSTSNKVLVFLNLAVGSSTNTSRTMIQLVRGTTNIGVGDDGGGNRTRSISTEFQPQPDSNGVKNNTDIRQHIFLDSPASTSALTYKVQIEGTAQTVYINRTGEHANADVVSIGTSSLTLMEIAG